MQIIKPILKFILYISYIRVFKTHRRLDGKPVAAFVFFMSFVAAHPYEIDLVNIEEREQGIPQIGVEGGLFVSLSPSVLFP